MNAIDESLPVLLKPYKTTAIAEACQVSTDAVYAWKRVERVPRDAEVIKRLAAFLRIDTDALLTILVADQVRLRTT